MCVLRKFQGAVRFGMNNRTKDSKGLWVLLAFPPYLLFVSDKKTSSTCELITFTENVTWQTVHIVEKFHFDLKSLNHSCFFKHCRILHLFPTYTSILKSSIFKVMLSEAPREINTPLVSCIFNYLLFHSGFDSNRSFAVSQQGPKAATDEFIDENNTH